MKKSENLYHMTKNNSIFQYSVESVVFNSSPEAIIVLDTIGRIIRINSRLTEWLDYTQDEVVGKHLLQLPFVSRETKNLLIRKYIARMAGKRVDSYTIECITKGGKIKIGRVRGNVIYDQNKKKIGDVVLVEEVTQEEEFRHLAKIRSSIIEIVGNAAHQFLKKKNWKIQLNGVFESLAKTCGAESIYLVHLRPDEKTIVTDDIENWSVSPLTPSEKTRLFNHSKFEKIISNHKLKLKEDQYVLLNSGSFLGIKSTSARSSDHIFSIIFPVFLGNRIWGILGFENISSHHRWSQNELQTLVLAKNIIQTALQRGKNSEEIEQKDLILQISNDFAQSLNSTKSWDATVASYLGKLGSILDADYLRYCPALLVEQGGVAGKAEWKSQQLPATFSFAYQDDCFQKCVSDFKDGDIAEPLHCTRQDHQEKFQQNWSKKFSQYLILQVGDENVVWGLLFIGTIDHQIPWSENEKESVQLFARIMSSALNKQKSFDEVARREKILTAVSDAAKHFLQYESWNQDMTKVLQKIGKSISADQVVLVINDLNQRIYDWCDDESPGCSRTGVFQEVMQARGPFKEYKKILSEKEVVYIQSEKKQSLALSKYLSKESIQSIVMLPFFVKGKWWGLLAIVHQQYDHHWSSSELKSFQIATDIISAAILNNLVELELKKTVEYWKQEERKVETEVQDKQKFQLAVSGSSDAIVITTPKPEIIYVNPAWERLTGYTLEEAMGKNPRILQSGKTVPHIYKEMWQKISSGDSFFSDEIVNKRKDGTFYPARLSVYPAMMNGKNIYYVGLQQDITELKHVEQLKTDFISIASHQMNTPLSALRWILELYQKKFDDKLEGDQKEMIGEMYESTLKMIDLITSLLNIARVESGRMMVQVRRINFNTLARQVVDEVTPIAEKKHVELKYELKARNTDISADPKVLTHIMTNLISNAIKYSSKKSAISISLSRNKNMFEFHVTDQGLGIPKSEQKRIFSKFYRASNVVRKEVDGSGLGLYLVKILVESAGGEIFFESSEGKGAHFWFTLPVSGMQKKSGEVSLADNNEMILSKSSK